MNRDPGEIDVGSYEALWHDGPAGAFITDAEGNWLAVNRRWVEITGVSEEQAIAQSGVRSLLGPEDAAALNAAWEHVLSRGGRFRVRIRFEHAERGTRYLAASAIAVLDDDGNRTGVLGTLFDETDQRLAELSLRSSEELHRLTISNLPGSAVGLYDLDMNCLLMEGIEAHGMTSETCRGKHITELVPPDSIDALMPGVEAALEGDEYQGEFFVSDRRESWTFHAAPFRDSDGAITGFMIVARDVTDQRKAEEEGRRTESLFQVAFDRAPIGMAIAELDERFRRVNAAMQEMLGLSEAELLAGATIDIIHPEDILAARDVIARVKSEGEATADLRFVGGGGRVIWVELRATLIRDDAGDPLHILAQLQDVTERRELIGRLEHLVAHDPLTGLCNRRGFKTALQAQIAVNERYGERGCLMIIDIDNFKSVNDTLGHAVGDELIVATANALRTRLRESDVIARLGGDEFAVILPEQDAATAVTVACELNAEIAAKARTIGAGLEEITASIGLTSLCAVGMDVGEALKRGDQAMYAAKRGGKNGVWLYGDTSTTTGIPTGSATRTEFSKSS